MLKEAEHQLLQAQVWRSLKFAFGPLACASVDGATEECGRAARQRHAAPPRASRRTGDIHLGLSSKKQEDTNETESLSALL